MKLFELSKPIPVVMVMTEISTEQISSNVEGLEEGQTAVYRIIKLVPKAAEGFVPDGNGTTKVFFAVKDAGDKYVGGRDRLLLETIDKNEKAAVGLCINCEMSNLVFSTAHYVLYKNDKGAFVRRTQSDGITPMVVYSRLLLRRTGTSGSFEQDAAAYVRQIIKQEAAGGGFTKRVHKNGDNEYVLEGSEKVVGTKDVDELDMNDIQV